ncbi:hypothetical protein KC19_10G027900 [Ceratodon purpureus]|uniref:Uncharacterized protein n=1 Tax=Ceratodon purpureus TaxID=3225 RepID=A0A8T0GN22_CERPU|nr:hypothetical protein KC19_10G027900 [Ceratodon purpureus]
MHPAGTPTQQRHSNKLQEEGNTGYGQIGKYQQGFHLAVLVCAATEVFFGGRNDGRIAVAVAGRSSSSLRSQTMLRLCNACCNGATLVRFGSLCPAFLSFSCIARMFPSCFLRSVMVVRVHRHRSVCSGFQTRIVPPSFLELAVLAALHSTAAQIFRVRYDKHSWVQGSMVGRAARFQLQHGLLGRMRVVAWQDSGDGAILIEQCESSRLVPRQTNCLLMDNSLDMRAGVISGIRGWMHGYRHQRRVSGLVV